MPSPISTPANTSVPSGPKSIRTQREAMVTSSGGTWSARITKTVLAGGSSTILSRGATASWARWNSVSSSTLRSASFGVRMASRRISLARSMDRNGPSRSTTSRSGWTSANVRTHTSHSPQPPRGHSRAAARAWAACRFPVPGGPTSR